MQFTRLADQSRGYLRAREELRVAEVELMRPRDQVADMRRQLPPGRREPARRVVSGARLLGLGPRNR